MKIAIIKRNYLSWLCYLAVIIMIFAGSFFFGAYWYIVHNHTIDFSALEYYNTGKPSVVLDLHGKEWTTFARDKRKPVALRNISQHLVNAFIATEDWTFFSHQGLSWKGILRSLLYNVYYGRKVQGASTITQQLVRLLFFDARKTFSRKLKEQFYALLVEQHFCKEQILEAYLNHVYFGCGIYGVEAASQRFWKKSAVDLTLDEAATLAGIVRSPGNYCPLLYPLSAQKRRNVVLNSMHKLKFVSDTDYAYAKEQPLQVCDTENTMIAPHFKEFLRQFLEELVGKEQLYYGGLLIQTTLDATLQEQAERAFTEQVKKLRTDITPDIDGALISLDVTTGEIRAMIGGFDFKKSKFDRAVQARRQMGSTLKSHLYAQALQHGLQFYDTDVDEPYALIHNNSTWQPKNFNGRFEGTITLARALIISSNIVAIKVLLKIGAEKLVDLAKACGLAEIIEPYPSLALGCIDVTLKDVGAAFNIFANHGNYQQPYAVRWIKDSLGTKIWRHTPVTKRVLPATVAGSVAKVMMTRFDWSRAMWQGKPLACQALSKTGTTNDSRTCWFSASTPELTTVIYIGCDDNRPMGKYVFPARTAFPIWMAMHTNIETHQKEFSFDPQLKEIFVHSRTGELLSDKNSRDAIPLLI